MRTCEVANCNEKHLCRGLCATHHARWKRHGDPTKTVNVPTPTKINWLEEAFLADTDDCIIWPFKVGTHGYGYLWIDGKIFLAHHYMLVLDGQPRPERGKSETRHLCNNKLCLNRRHLKTGSHKENAADREAAGVVYKGEDHVGAKLTTDDVLSIREDDRSCRELSKVYGVSNQLISAIKNRKRWAHIN